MAKHQHQPRYRGIAKLKTLRERIEQLNSMCKCIACYGHGHFTLFIFWLHSIKNVYDNNFNMLLHKKFSHKNYTVFSSCINCC